MANFDVPINSDGNPILSFGAALSGRKITIDTTGEKTHPARALVNAARRLAPALTLMLDTLDETNGLRPTGDQVEKRLSSAFQELCFRAAEFFDVFQTDIPKSIPILKSRSNKSAVGDFQRIIKARRNDWAFICNKIKHNHNIIAPVKIIYQESFRAVYGFSLVRPTGHDSMRLNIDFHKKPERCRAYSLVLRQLIYDIFRADRAAYSLIGKIIDEENAGYLPEFKLSFGIGAELQRLEKTYLWALPQERRMIDGFRLLNGNVHFERQKVESISEEGRISIQYAVDGFARTFQII